MCRYVILTEEALFISEHHTGRSNTSVTAIPLKVLYCIVLLFQRVLNVLMECTYCIEAH